MENKIINREYWLGFGYDLIDNGLKTIHKEIGDVDKYINGLLGFYAAITTLGSIYSRIVDFWHYFYIVLPILVIKVFGWYANVFSKPKPIEFFPDSPQSCEWAHDVYFKQAERHLSNMKVFALISTILILGGFVYINWESVNVKKANDSNTKKIEFLTKENDSIKNLVVEKEGLIQSLQYQKRIDFNVQYAPQDNEIVVLGVFPKEKIIKVEILDSKLNSLVKRNLLSGKNGRIHNSFDIGSTSEKMALIVVEFDLSKKEKRIIRKEVVLY